MSEVPDREALRAEILKNDLEAYRKLETWGSSLFLGALGLLGRQLLQWDEPGRTFRLDRVICMLPAAIGLTAFLFLRVVNYRSHKIDRQLRDMAGIPKRLSIGAVGLLLALMPLSFGYGISWYLSDGSPYRQGLFWFFVGLGGFVFVLCLTIHLIVRVGERK